MIPTRCLDMFPSALALAAAFVLSTGCLDAPENYYGIDLTQVTFELESTEMGIHPSKAVLEAVSNPFRENDVGAEMKWTVLSYGGSAAAFYAFFRVDGMSNSLDFAKRLATEFKVGVAPGTAFGPSGEGWLRLCFAQSPLGEIET